jgi:AcrR family transcriptional regulator
MATRSKPARKPPKPRHGDLKKRLCEEALAIVEEEGVDALTLRKLAGRLGVTPGAPYHHFADKDALLATLAEEGFRLLLAAMLARAAAAGDDPTRRLQAISHAYIDFAIAHPGTFRVTFRPPRAGWEPFPLVIENAGLTFFALAAAVQQAGGDPTDTVAMWTLAHGIATLWIDGPLQLNPHIRGNRAAIIDKIVESYVGTFPRGAGA